MQKQLLLILTIFLSFACAWSQDRKTDSLHVKLKRVYSELDSLFSSSDSTSTIGLIESFLTSPRPKDSSKLLVRLGYNSNISAMNQTLGINQFGISPGISYYHKSGLYADVSSYWSKQFVPPVYLTIFSAGYLNALSRKYLLNLEYSYLLYPNRDDSTTPYTNSFTFGNQLDFTPIQFRIDYYYYFGSQTAHRILPSLGLTFEKKNVGKIKRLAFIPSFSILFGTESTQEYVPLTLSAQQILDRLKTGGSLYNIETVTVFGLMNYSFTFPFSARTKSWAYQLSYTYNIPRALPDEELSLANTGYLSMSIGRYIKL